jgi:hypothetical protein
VADRDARKGFAVRARSDVGCKVAAEVTLSSPPATAPSGDIQHRRGFMRRPLVEYLGIGN